MIEVLSATPSASQTSPGISEENGALDLAESCDMDTRVKSVINIMRRGLPDDLSIRILSKAVNLSSARLRQLFKKDAGRSPMQYLRDLRMQTACELLRSTFLSIKEITARSGIGDTSHFGHDFKKRYGVTPSEFRADSETTIERTTNAPRDS